MNCPCRLSHATLSRLASYAEKTRAMTTSTEDDVRTAAKFQRYDLIKFSGDYQLEREREKEIITASTLESIVDFLKH